MLDQRIGFLDFFKKVPDHRLDRKKLYPVEEILLLSFCGMIAGCDSWDDIELFGKLKLDILRTYLPYQSGIPSDDTLRRFFRTLDPSIFQSKFVDWVKSFQLKLEHKVVAVDGKTSRRCFDNDSKPMHMVSAFVSEIGITLGQVKTHDKSNEITAIPELLEMLDIKHAIVTIDAMGCQYKIADSILSKKADYLLALKGNQGTLSDDVTTFYEQPPQNASFSFAEETDKGHGRIEIRRCKVTENIDWLRQSHPKWNGLRSIVEIESIRDVKGSISQEKRYYITSLASDANMILNAVRQHWGIENKLHWVLDMTFNDDHSRIRKGNAPQNMTVLKNTALNLLRAMKQKPQYKRVSLKAMRKMAGWDKGFLDGVLNAKF